MVIRHYINCLTCNTPHTLRVSVGHNPYQEHTFSCTNCNEEITVGLNVDFQNTQVDFKYVNNCESGDKEGIIVNLHPDFAIPADQVHVDRVFPWLADVHQVAGVFLQNNPDVGRIFDLRSALWGRRSPFEEWEILRKAWSLSKNGKDDLAKKKLAEYVGSTSQELPTIKDALFHFSFKLLLPKKIKLFIDAIKLIQEIVKDHPDEFARFREFFIKNHYPDHLERFFELYSDYFRDFTEYSQTLIYVKCDIELPDNFKASSNAFKRTKMFYGNAFEALTTNIMFLACLNNVYKGRQFDKFESMDLNNYLTINKANRASPFKDTVAFASFTKCFDSTLRNASHHGAMKIDNKSGMLSYRSGGTGALREMSYSSYLLMCNEMMLSAVALLNVELILGQ